MTDNWFKIQTIYAITSSLQQYENVNEEDDEDDVLKRIRMSNMGMVDGYEVDTAYLNIVCDPIVGCYLVVCYQRMQRTKSITQN
jgi:hypothetical protein